MGDSDFKKIGNGTYVYTTPKDAVNEMKYKMLDLLLTKTDGTTYDYAHCFKRSSNIELHRECTAVTEQTKWYFEDKNNGYKFIMTQINKSDIIEKRLTPTYNEKGTTEADKWEQGNSPITPDEFFYLLMKTASESSVQQLAIAEAVKNTYGTDKLVVYDAQLYNQFDSTWIKDWKKKPIGGGN